MNRLSDLDASRFRSPQRDVIAPQAQLERITEGRALDQRDFDSRHEAHLEQAHRHRPMTAHGSDEGVLSERELVEGLGLIVLKSHFNMVDSTWKASVQTGLTHAFDELSVQN
jgi:hypothetical protein